MDTVSKVKEFCARHGLAFVLQNPTEDRSCGEPHEPYYSIGLSGFFDGDVETLEDLQATLEECLQEHREIANTKWRPGLLYQALHAVGDDPTKAAIEDEIGQSFDEETLDRIAQIFYKYTR